MSWRDDALGDRVLSLLHAIQVVHDPLEWAIDLIAQRQGGMMGGGMGPGMMSKPMMMGGDPKQQAEMLAMRGEMMKAMGDIMMKYAQRAQPAK